MSGLFETRAEALEWLTAQRLTHLARLNFEFLHPLGAKRRLIDLINRADLARVKSMLGLSNAEVDRLSEQARAFVERERADTLRARERRIAPPTDPRAKQVFDELLAVRATVPGDVAPALQLATSELRIDPAALTFALVDERPSEVRSAGVFAKAEAQLSLRPRALSCTCRFESCAHRLCLIDTALAWCAGAGLEQSGTLDALTKPEWQRTLEALGSLAGQRLPSPDADHQRVSWSIRHVDAETGELEIASLDPVASRRPRSAERMHAFDVLRRSNTAQAENRAVRSRQDTLLAALMPAFGPVSHTVLEAMVDAPNVVLGDDLARAVKVDRAVVGLVAEDRLGVIHVRPSVDGAAIPDSLRDRIRDSKADEPLFLWDEGPRRLTVLDATPELKTMLGVLKGPREAFPHESQAQLLEVLSRLAVHLPVAMPRTVMGQTVPATAALVLRLHPDRGAAMHGISVDLRIRPFAGAPSVVPGQGARDVHARLGEKAVHAVRDLKAEAAAAEALYQALPLSKATPLSEPFQFYFDDAASAFDVIEAASQHRVAVELEWVGQPLRSYGQRGAGALRVALETKREWFGVLGELRVEGERVELARLIEAVRRKERRIRVSTHSFVELSATLQQHLEHLAAHLHAGRGGGLELGVSALGAVQALETAGATVEACDEWAAFGQRLAAAQQTSFELPKGLEATLRTYQVEGFKWLARLAEWGAGAVLADDMGLGKTVQTLALLLHRKKLGPALVVAPTSVAFNWSNEAKRFAPSLKVVVYAEAQNRIHALQSLKPGHVLVVSYGLLVSDLERLAGVRFATAIFDEAQQVKNGRTQRARASRHLNADFKLALSGTPFENHLGELWSVFATVFPPLLGSWETFRGRYAVPIEKNIDPSAAPALAAVLQPFLLRRTKAQVAPELPPRTEVTVPVVLSSAEWQLYEDARLEALSQLKTPRRTFKEQQRKVEVLAALTRLRLIASHPRLFDPRSTIASSKLARLLELLEELRAEGHRTLVFSQFVSHLALVREALDARGFASVYLDGSTPRAARAERVSAFQEGDAPVFLISLKAGGVGLNLTAATTVIHVDPWWNPAVEDQASDRAHRLGQTKPVTIFRLVSLATIEEKMLGFHESKRSLVVKVLSGSDLAGTLSANQLVALMQPFS